MPHSNKSIISLTFHNKLHVHVLYPQDRDMSHRQSPCGDSLAGVGTVDGGKEAEGHVDQLMALGDSETVCSNSAFEQWDSYWEDLTR